MAVTVTRRDGSHGQGRTAGRRLPTVRLPDEQVPHGTAHGLVGGEPGQPPGSLAPPRHDAAGVDNKHGGGVVHSSRIDPRASPLNRGGCARGGRVRPGHRGGPHPRGRGPLPRAAFAAGRRRRKAARCPTASTPAGAQSGPLTPQGDPAPLGRVRGRDGSGRRPPGDRPSSRAGTMRRGRPVSDRLDPGGRTERGPHPPGVDPAPPAAFAGGTAPGRGHPATDRVRGRGRCRGAARCPTASTPVGAQSQALTHAGVKPARQPRPWTGPLRAKTARCLSPGGRAGRRVPCPRGCSCAARCARPPARSGPGL